MPASSLDVLPTITLSVSLCLSGVIRCRPIIVTFIMYFYDLRSDTKILLCWLLCLTVCFISSSPVFVHLFREARGCRSDPERAEHHGDG